jgi:UDP-glucose:(heptosyl)LPS alpha-1,3-glucosyltransferase
MKPTRRGKSLNIAFVLDRYHPAGRGEAYFSWLIDELSSRGHNLHVFCASADRGTPSHVRIHRVPTLKHPRSLLTVSFLMNAARHIQKGNFDIVHGVGKCLCINVFNPHGGVERAYLRQEFASITNRFYFMVKLLKRYLSVNHYLKVWIEKNQYSGNTKKRFIAISQMVKRDMIDYYDVPEEKISVVSNCVDLERFHPRNHELYRTRVRDELGIAEKTLILLFAGNNYRLKGLEYLLGALASLGREFPERTVSLFVAGRGQVGRYSRLARRLGILENTRFLGPVQHMERFYGASDIYVHPTFYDPCSLTLLEALATGLPVVTTRFNGAADLVASDDGGRVIDDPKDISTIAESIAFYFPEARRREARRVTRQWMEDRSPAHHIEKILGVYDAVMEQR